MNLTPTAIQSVEIVERLVTPAPHPGKAQTNLSREVEIAEAKFESGPENNLKNEGKDIEIVNVVEYILSDGNLVATTNRKSDGEPLQKQLRTEDPMENLNPQTSSYPVLLWRFLLHLTGVLLDESDTLQSLRSYIISVGRSTRPEFTNILESIMLFLRLTRLRPILR